MALAAPLFVKKRNELSSRDVAICAAAVVLMLIPAVGSVYPVPPAPVRYFPYVFLGYLLVGGLRVSRLRRSAPERLQRIRAEIQTQILPVAAGLAVQTTGSG